MAGPSVIVVGAGAAGLMAAGRAAEAGAQTLLVEKMDRPGRKLAISGNGRCNLTNTAPLAEFLPHFGAGGKFLRPALSEFGPRELAAFFRELGVRTTTRADGRVFPASGRAEDVVQALVEWARRRGATIERHRVRRLVLDGSRVTGIDLVGGEVRSAVAVVVATGGASYPATGSTGQGYELAAQAGHTIVPIRPALVPIVTAGTTSPRLQGLTLKDVVIRLVEGGKRKAERSGDIVFTHFGVSGPAVLALSKQVVDALGAGHPVALSIDIVPGLDSQELDGVLVGGVRAHGKQLLAGWLKKLLPRTLIPVCLEAAGISADLEANQLTAGERRRLRTWLKDFRLEVSGHRGFAEAMVTSGGVSTREVDPRSMASRLAPGLYFAGEVLDIDADTGGFNLQAAFSTGSLAGRAAAAAAAFVSSAA